MNLTVIFLLLLYVSVTTVVDMTILRITQSWPRRLGLIAPANSLFPLICFAVSERLLFGPVIVMLGNVCLALGPIAFGCAVLIRKAAAMSVPAP